MERVIKGFGTERLLTFDRDPATREPTVEVGHEALLTEWPRLKAWVDEDREGLRFVRRVGEASEAWAAAGRDDADLFRGARLETLTEWTTANPGRLSANEGEFVAASMAARDAARSGERRNTRRLHRLVVGVSVALVVALVAGTIAVAQRNEATDQRNRARSQSARWLRAPRSGPLRRHAPQASDEWPSRPGHSRRRTTHKRCSSRSRPIGCSRAPTPWVPSRSRSSRSRHSSDRCTRRHC